MPSGSGRPSPSGARLGGDDYQHVFTWLHGFKILVADEGVTKIEFEVADLGGVDDLIVHYVNKPPLYNQIKFATTQSEQLDYEWFMRPPSGGKATPLQKFHRNYVKLRDATGSRPRL